MPGSLSQQRTASNWYSTGQDAGNAVCVIKCVCLSLFVCVCVSLFVCVRGRARASSWYSTGQDAGNTARACTSRAWVFVCVCGVGVRVLQEAGTQRDRAHGCTSLTRPSAQLDHFIAQHRLGDALGSERVRMYALVRSSLSNCHSNSIESPAS